MPETQPQWRLRCLLCDPGTQWNQPDGLTDLVAMQEHAMAAHGIAQEDFRRQTPVCLAPDHYQYKIYLGVHPDLVPNVGLNRPGSHVEWEGGQLWLDAVKK